MAEKPDVVIGAGIVGGALPRYGSCGRGGSVVLTTGAWSKPLMRKPGLRVPLATERGHYIGFENAEGGPTKPVMIDAGKFGAMPMTRGGCDAQASSSLADWTPRRRARRSICSAGK